MPLRSTCMKRSERDWSFWSCWNVQSMFLKPCYWQAYFRVAVVRIHFHRRRWDCCFNSEPMCPYPPHFPVGMPELQTINGLCRTCNWIRSVELPTFS
jgi:hypothetical protein